METRQQKLIFDLLKNHQKSKCLLTIVERFKPFGLGHWDINHKATVFDEKPILNHFIGYAVISPNFLIK